MSAHTTKVYTEMNISLITLIGITIIMIIYTKILMNVDVYRNSNHVYLLIIIILYLRVGINYVDCR